MADIKSVTIHKINLGTAILRKYQVEYYSGIIRTFDTPPSNIEKFIRENRREMQKVKYKFIDKSD